MNLGRRAILAAVLAATAICAMPAGASAGVISVSATGDENPPSTNGTCTLREAVSEANSDNPSTSADCTFSGTLNYDIIDLPGSHYNLTGSVDEGLNQQGDLDITDPGPDGLILQGASSTTTIEAQGADRVFDLLNGDLGLIHISVLGGQTTNQPGAGIRALADLELEDSSVSTTSSRARRATWSTAGGSP